MNNSLNASLLAAAGIDARLLSQVQSGGLYGGSTNSTSSLERRTKAESPVQRQQSVQKEDTSTQQQRQAAAKLALRKQLEKTLLQVAHSITRIYTRVLT